MVTKPDSAFEMILFCVQTAVCTVDQNDEYIVERGTDAQGKSQPPLPVSLCFEAICNTLVDVDLPEIVKNVCLI